MANRDYPTGAAQDVILKALNLTANGFSDAERIFAEIGIAVSSKRVGRSSVPVVTRLETHGGGWNAGGDADGYKISYKDVDLSAIAQYMQ